MQRAACTRLPQALTLPLHQDQENTYPSTYLRRLRHALTCVAGAVYRQHLVDRGFQRKDCMAALGQSSWHTNHTVRQLTTSLCRHMATLQSALLPLQRQKLTFSGMASVLGLEVASHPLPPAYPGTP